MNDCVSIKCSHPPGDYAAYGLQRDDTENAARPIPVAAACPKKECAVEPPPDYPVYSLQSGAVFNGTALRHTIVCPPGYTCRDGTVDFPPGTIVLPPVQPNGTYTLEGCLGTITGTDAQAVLNEYARQQAICSGIQEPPGPGGYYPPSGPALRTNDEVQRQYALQCDPPSFPRLNVALPHWITWDSANSRFVGAAGTFTADTKAAANAAAQQALNLFVSAAIESGALSCVRRYTNTLQQIACGARSSDIHKYTRAIDGNGLYAVNGTFYAAEGYYESLESQAAADAAALAALEEWRSQVEAAGQTLCVHECAQKLITGEYCEFSNNSGVSSKSQALFMGAYNASITGHACVQLPPYGPTNCTPSLLGRMTLQASMYVHPCMFGKPARLSAGLQVGTGCTRWFGNPDYPPSASTTVRFADTLAGASARANFNRIGSSCNPGISYDLSDASRVVMVPNVAINAVTTCVNSGTASKGPLLINETCAWESTSGHTIEVASASGIGVSNYLYIDGAGVFRVTTISGTTLTCEYVGSRGNPPSASWSPGAVVYALSGGPPLIDLLSDNDYFSGTTLHTGRVDPLF